MRLAARTGLPSSAGDLSLLDRYPTIAGFIFGLLSYKPHLGIS